jgi:argininosuccinate lyase
MSGVNSSTTINLPIFEHILLFSTHHFASRRFHGVITEEDADRIWSAVENAIKTMAEEEEIEWDDSEESRSV